MTKFVLSSNLEGLKKSSFSPKGGQFYKSKIRKSGYH